MRAAAPLVLPRSQEMMHKQNNETHRPMKNMEMNNEQ
jgi:hypothetical protein